jgi:HD-like signal output (HDOD) protein
MNARDDLRRRVGRLRSVPTLPKLLERIATALEDPEVDFANLADLIEIDQALTAQILRLANSAFYGSQNSITNVSQALPSRGASSSPPRSSTCARPPSAASGSTHSGAPPPRARSPR